MRRIIQNIYSKSDSIKPFPVPESVFVEPIDKYFTHLLPLVSVDLQMLNSQWLGWIHFITPIEPYDGVIGEYTQEYHTYYLRKNWIGFKIRDGKYELLGDFGYFSLEKHSLTPSFQEPYDGYYDDLRKRYKSTYKYYDEKLQQFRKYGAIYHRWAEKDESGMYKDEDRHSLVSELGGRAYWDNWSNGFTFDEVDCIDEEGYEALEVIPLTKDNRPFKYIGSVTGHNYIEGGADDILLFYDPEDQIALFTFNWT